VGLLEGVEVNLHLLEFDAGVSELAIEVTVSMNLSGESPVIMVNEGIMEQRKINRGAHHKEAEPRWEWECRFCVTFLIVLVVGLSIEIDDVGRGLRPIGVGEA